METKTFEFLEKRVDIVRLIQKHHQIVYPRQNTRWEIPDMLQGQLVFFETTVVKVFSSERKREKFNSKLLFIL